MPLWSAQLHASSQKTTVASIHPNDCLGSRTGTRPYTNKPHDVVGHDLIDISFEPFLGINFASLWKKSSVSFLFIAHLVHYEFIFGALELFLDHLVVLLLSSFWPQDFSQAAVRSSISFTWPLCT